MDDDVRVLLITGEGRAFSAGDDITGRGAGEGHQSLSKLPPLPSRRPDNLGLYGSLRTTSQELIRRLRLLDKVTIAAMNGVAIQYGLSVALACDFRIASRTARLGSATLRFGYQPDEGGHFLLLQQLGLPGTLDFLLRNRIVDAEEAHRLGLVNEVVEPDELLPKALELATELAEGPQVATRLLKRAIYIAAESNFEQALDDIATKTAISDYHPDSKEGVQAWQQKRAPRFNQSR
jgi:2-(1,2-epoxy-1,2-dihydrophenyl)acetyl-CoA isomerase